MPSGVWCSQREPRRHGCRRQCATLCGPDGPHMNGDNHRTTGHRGAGRIAGGSEQRQTGEGRAAGRRRRSNKTSSRAPNLRPARTQPQDAAPVAQTPEQRQVFARPLDKNGCKPRPPTETSVFAPPDKNGTPTPDQDKRVRAPPRVKRRRLESTTNPSKVEKAEHGAPPDSIRVGIEAQKLTLTSQLQASRRALVIVT